MADFRPLVIDQGMVRQCADEDTLLVGILTGSGTVTGAHLKDTSLTSGRVVYVTTAGQLVDSVNLTFSGSALNLAGTCKINANSTNAFLVEQTGVKNNVFAIDTTTGLVRVGVGTNYAEWAKFVVYDASNLNVAFSSAAGYVAFRLISYDADAWFMFQNGHTSDCWYCGTDYSNSNVFTFGFRAAAGGQPGDGDVLRLTTTKLVGLGVNPTAVLHLKAGTASANTAPLKFTSGTLLSSPEAGAMEFLTDDLCFTITTGAARQKVVLTAGLTSGRVPYGTTNGRLTDSAGLTFDGTNLNVGSGGLVGSGLQLPHVVKKAPSVTVRNSHDAEVTTTSASYVKVKTITLTNGLVGAARFLFDLKTGTAPTAVYGRIYRNGVALGDEQSDTTGGYVTKSQDIIQTWNPGDACELWVHSDGAATACVQDFRIAYDDAPTVAVASVNS